MKLPTITIALIARNEAHNLDAFFETIAPIADELVVSYTPSADDTLKKLEEWKAKVPYSVDIFEYADFPFHFGKSRNETIGRASSSSLRRNSRKRSRYSVRMTLRRISSIRRRAS